MHLIYILKFSISAHLIKPAYEILVLLFKLCIQLVSLIKVIFSSPEEQSDLCKGLTQV